MKGKIVLIIVYGVSIGITLWFHGIKLVQDIYQLCIGKKMKSKSFTFYDTINKGLWEQYNFDAFVTRLSIWRNIKWIIKTQKFA